ncbi:MAG: hypothetical protein JRN53_00575 [Nitrososphaerota archaeon]|nr:hypothetical protein [Nitrososphaerota archaeon]MDG7039813.1 hypothetical protein [Nitrososphaerota archaeon]MDG7042332.1 hypothetical protein [Nitrososphaerota archaeon]MDG7046071.1 hypothetical protein [Nitrososphaerota archaeon]MDG7047518.1 hypothetical protein [Nitrososphaerota archaeon]
MNRKLVRAYVDGLITQVINDPNGPLAESQAKTARRMLMKARIKQPKEIRMLFCKRCKSYAPPLSGKTVRINRGHLAYTCKICGGVSRIYYK